MQIREEAYLPGITQSLSKAKRIHLDRAKAAVSSGLESSVIVAYHGTSVYTLAETIRNGIQPGAATTNLSRKGDVFIFPISESYSLHRFASCQPEVQALKCAERHARMTARTHYIAKSIGLDDISVDAPMMNYLRDLVEFHDDHSLAWDHPRGYVHFRERGISMDVVRLLLARSEEHKGIVLGYSRDVVDKRSPMTHEGAVLRVLRPAMSDIIGIELLDSFSQDVMRYL